MKVVHGRTVTADWFIAWDLTRRWATANAERLAASELELQGWDHRVYDPILLGAFYWCLADVLQYSSDGAQEIFCLLGKRESLQSTGIGHELAVPHTKTGHCDDGTKLCLLQFKDCKFEFYSEFDELCHTFAVLILDPTRPGDGLRAREFFSAVAKRCGRAFDISCDGLCEQIELAAGMPFVVREITDRCIS